MAEQNFTQLAYDWARKAEQNLDDKHFYPRLHLAVFYAHMAGVQQEKRIADQLAAGVTRVEIVPPPQE